MSGDEARYAVLTALELGYRHIDTATIYGNEREVGKAFASSGLLRGSVFITTKLPGDAKDLRATIERSLTDLEIDYVDLWLIHWPPARSYLRSTNSSQAMYEGMLALRDEGLTQAVGVSNYSTEEIDELIAATGDGPEVNQIPWSPFDHDASIRDDLDARDICLEGYSPLTLSRLADPVLVAIARSHGATAAQVVLRWHVQHRIVVLPKSVHLERIRENCDLAGFALTPEEMRRLDNLAGR
jgi:diketogulonate reductase-like aldo/keto reductase